MLSVLIPIYNTDARPFAQQLLDEIERSGIETEVIFIDDASDASYREMNRAIGNMRFMKYEELDQNIGRSRIRNLLATRAKYDWMLLVDGDSQICAKNYLQNYLKYAVNPNQLIYGGTAYGQRPTQKDEYLHWLYGTERECLTAEKRNQNRFGTFKTNNFLVHKALFSKVKFDETVQGYGHEDTLFAKDLERKGFEILHIENPLLHNGLETNANFLSKQKNALDNLVRLYQQGKLGDEIRLIRFYHQVKKWRLLWLVKLLYLKNEKTLEENLLSDHPKLGNLDRLKMAWFMEKIS